MLIARHYLGVLRASTTTAPQGSHLVPPPRPPRVTGSARAAPPDAGHLRTVAPAAGVAGRVVAIWLLVDPRTPDLAAQVYRVGLFHQLGFAVWDEHWYAGHDLPGYSLLFPPLARCSACASLGALSRARLDRAVRALARPMYGTAARWGTAWFALAALGDVWLGRLAFALGVSFALGGGARVSARARLGGGCWPLLCAAASPVAGALLGARRGHVALPALAARSARARRAGRRGRVVPLALLFPEGGYEPYPVLSFAATAVVVVLFLLALPAERGCCGSGAAVSAGVPALPARCTRRWAATSSATGCCSAGPLLLCVLLGAGRANGAAAACSRRDRRARRSDAVVAVGARPVRGRGLGAVGPRARDARGGGQRSHERRLLPPGGALPGQSSARGPVRVEVPLTRSHWEAALLAPQGRAGARLGEAARQPLRRGAADGGLTARGLRAWLHQQAVAYVALPGRPARPVERPGGAPDPRGAAVPARGVHERPLACLPGARRRRRSPRVRGG